MYKRQLREQLDRLTALVRTLLEMSNLQSISRTDQIALAPVSYTHLDVYKSQVLPLPP